MKLFWTENPEGDFFTATKTRGNSSGDPVVATVSWSELTGEWGWWARDKGGEESSHEKAMDQAEKAVAGSLADKSLPNYYNV